MASIESTIPMTYHSGMNEQILRERRGRKAQKHLRLMGESGRFTTTDALALLRADCLSRQFNRIVASAEPEGVFPIKHGRKGKGYAVAAELSEHVQSSKSFNDHSCLYWTVAGLRRMHEILTENNIPHAVPPELEVLWEESK